MCVFLWCEPDLIMSHLSRKTAPLSQLSRVTCTLFHFCWYSVIGREVIVRYNWWSYHSVLSCISRFSDCGANMKRKEQEKKARGGVGSESGMTFTGLPRLSLSPSLFYSALWLGTTLHYGLDQALLNSAARCSVNAVLQSTYFSNPWLFNSSTHFCVKWSILSSR